MTVYIHMNGSESDVFRDLRTIVADPGLSASMTSFSVPDPDGGAPVSVRADGRVFFRTAAPATPDIGNGLVRALVNDASLHVLVRAESPGFDLLPGTKLITVAGATTPIRTVGSTRMVQIIYDVAGCNTGSGAKGYWVLDGSGAQIDMPPDVVLLHELLHAFRQANGTMDPADPEGQIVRSSPSENDYRTLKSYPLRSTAPATVHSGGPRCALPPAPAGTKPPPDTNRGTSKGCFVATAAYGSELEPEVDRLRRFRDDVLLKTRVGTVFFERFYSYYEAYSPQIADAMRANPDMAASFKVALVEPISHFLEFALRRPDGDFEEVPEPWRSYLTHVLGTFDSWMDDIELPSCFCGLTPLQAARELAVLLPFVLHSPQRRCAYLDQLEHGGMIPLALRDARAEAAELLRSVGVVDAELDRVIGVGVTAGGAALGGNENPDIPGQNPSQWFYTVTFTNMTNVAANPADQPIPIPLDFRLFYKRVGLAGVVFQEVLNVAPGSAAVFPMGVCAEMESYAWGMWGYIEVDGTLQYERLLASSDLGLGDITPQKANLWSQQHPFPGVPADTDGCADSWRITS